MYNGLSQVYCIKPEFEKEEFNSFVFKGLTGSIYIVKYVIPAAIAPIMGRMIN